MINHARTLLLNQSANRTDPSDPGYEYIQPNYKALELPTTLDTIHSIIFGKTPDNRFLNYRSRELLSYLHQTELAEYVYALDPRVTYWPAMNDNKLYASPRKIFVKQLAGNAARLAVGGIVNSSNATGRTDYEYTVLAGYQRTTNFDEKPVCIVQPLPKNNKPVVTVFDSLARVSAVPLVGSDLSARPDIGARAALSRGRLITESSSILVIEDYSETLGGDILLENIEDVLGVIGAGELSVNFLASSPFPLLGELVENDIAAITGIWTVAATANPSPAIISTLPNLEFLGEPTYLSLFGVAPQEPYKTFQNLWEDHPLPAYRLSGMVLAFIYRVNELLRI